MHRCLQISEILDDIVEKIFQPIYDCKWHCPRPRGRRDLRDVLAVALVSKAFCEPALDALWTFQHSLLFLVKTFPPDLWFETNDSSETLVRFFDSHSPTSTHVPSKQDVSTTPYPIGF
jgi:hypothetical protein